ncbi:MAG: HPr family phosphocarrier protein [Candidatus Firestonebacteria bacterium]
MEIEVMIQNKLGLHLRAAAVLIKLANTFKCEITISKENQSANGKSIMGIMALAASPGTKLKVNCEGADEAEACTKIKKLVDDKFGEKE